MISTLTEQVKRLKESMIIQGDSLEQMKYLPDKSIDLVFTSPPYAGNFREYSEKGDPRDLGQLDTEEYIEKFIPYVKEIDRLLRHEEGGVFILNIGEKYLNGFASTYPERLMLDIIKKTNLKLIDKVPWIKCLSENTYLYVEIYNEKYSVWEFALCKIKDLVKLKPEIVKLWNGENWTKVHSWIKSTDNNNVYIHLELKKGSEINCTLDHQWPCQRGLLKTKDLIVGDILKGTKFPGESKDIVEEDFEIIKIENKIKNKTEKFWSISVEDEPHYFALASGVLSKNCDPFPNKKSRIGVLGWEHIFVFGSDQKLINKNINYLKSPYRTSNLSISLRKDFKKMRKQTNHPMNDAKCFDDIGALERNYVASHHRMMTQEEFDYLEEHYVVSATQNFGESIHKAQMPISLAEYFVGGYSQEGQIVMDPFGGCGTTAAVAWRLNREFIHIDLLDENCKIAEKRISKISKRTNVFNFYGLSSDKKSKFNEIKENSKINGKKIF